MSVNLLETATFRDVVEATPLVSIDLVVRHPTGKVLLGLRNNRPAKGFWFVPGGRIHKSETLDSAFLRLTKVELGTPVERSECGLLGVFEHMYDDSVFGENPKTHYVVLAYCLPMFEIKNERLPLTQHSHFKWWSIEKVAKSNQVHLYTKKYMEYLSI